jgi:GAF domain-containing protein/ActR/RegA family two-component response regulator
VGNAVLVVYDDDDLRDSLCESVQEAGYAVEGADSGEAAIARVRQAEGKFDFVLMDQVLLNGMDGLQATRIIHGEYPAIRIIVLTQYGDGESSRQALESGAYRYVFLPCLDEEITNLMKYSASLAKLEQGLEDARSIGWMQQIADEPGMAISIIDRTYRVLYANTGQRQLAGQDYRPGGICWVEFHQAYLQNEPCIWCPVKPLFETGEPIRKTAVLFKRGRAQYYETSASPIFDQDGRTILAARKWGIEVTAREIIDRRTLEAATLEQRLDAVLERIRMLGYSRVRLYELSEDGLFLIGRKERGGTNVPFSEIHFAVKDDRYSQVTLASSAPRIYKAAQYGPTQLDYELDRVGLEEWLDVPLCTSEGGFVGKITIDNRIIGPLRPDRESRPKPINEEHFELLMKVATFAANAISWERDQSRIGREAEKLRNLRAIDADIASELGVMTVVQRTLLACVDLTGASSAHISLRDGGKLIKVAGIGPYSDIVERELSMDLHRDVPAVWAILAGEPYIANDAQRDAYIAKWVARTTDRDARTTIDSTGSFASFPLSFEGEMIGALSLQSGRKDFFTEEICDFVKDLQPRLARALRNAQLYERRIKESEALRKADEAVLSVAKLDEVLQVILDQLSALIPCKSAQIRLFDEDSQQLELRATTGRHPGEIPKWSKMGVGIAGQAAQEKQTILENDVAQNPAHQRALQECGNHKQRQFLDSIQAEVASPLKIGEKLTGVLCLQDTEAPGFLEADLPLVTNLAGRASIAIENARLRQQLERRVEQLRSMSIVATRIQSTSDSDTMLRLALTGVTAKQALRFSRAVLFLANDDRTTLEGRMAVGAVTYEEADAIWREVEEKQFSLEAHLDRAEKLGKELNKPLNDLIRKISIPIRAESGAPAMCLLEKRAIIVSDARTDHLSNRQLAEALGMAAFAAVPLIAKGEFVGTLVVDNRFLPKGTIEDESVRVLETFASEAAMIIENARLGKELAEQERVKASKEFAARAAHRIGTEVSVIEGSLTETTEGLVVDSGRLQAGVERMKSVLQELKEFARPREPQFQMIALGNLVGKVSRRLPPELNFSFVTDLAEDLPLLEGDVEALSDTFLELVHNAMDEMPKDGSGQVTIRATVLPPGSPNPTEEEQPLHLPHICIEFADNGPGVPSEKKEAIFRPFYSVKAKGSGLGLTIVKQLVEEMHHGVIKEMGTYGQGARFVILLPISQPKGG